MLITMHIDRLCVTLYLCQTGILKVGDFGISKMLTSDSEAADSIVGTPYYMSPEICRFLICKLEIFSGFMMPRFVHGIHFNSKL